MTTITRARILQVADSLGLLETGGPGSLASLIVRLGDSTTPIDEIVELIERQPALCARVLRVANSAYYGHSRSIASIGGSVMLLGQNCVRAIATATCAYSAMTRQVREVLPDVAKMVQHSIAVAIAAQSLARVCLPALTAEAFMSGILHDLGFLLLSGVAPRETAQMLEARQLDPNGDIRLLESAAIGIGHEECATILLDEWRLPEPLIAAVGHHHAPESAPTAHRRLARLVNVAEALSTQCGYTFSAEPGSPSEPSGAGQSPHGLERLGLRAPDVSAVIARLPEHASELCSALTGT